MKWSRTALLSALLVSPALAQQESICDKYTTALLMNNTGSNQLTLLTLLVNTALIGNYTSNKTAVTGILVPGKYNNKTITLLPYFNGGLLSTNRGEKGSAVNFLDDGGAIPLAENKAANTQTSNQYRLLTHLYQYFGVLLGCSKVGQDGFPAYQGSTRMYELHKFMNLDPDEMGYFIQEVALSAASFGVAESDIQSVGTALNNAFNMRCSPKAAIPPSAAPDFQAICINSACPTVTSGAVCTSYNKNQGEGVDPATASSTSGPQLTDLAPQLSSIQAGQITPGAGAGSGPISYTTSVYTSSTSGASSSQAYTTVVPIGGGEVKTVTSSGMTYTTTIPSSVISEIVSTVSTNSSSYETTIQTTEANTALNSVISGSVTSVQSVETSVVVSGSSTITHLITTSVASTLPVSTSTHGGAAPIQTAAVGMMAVLGAAGLVGQML